MKTLLLVLTVLALWPSSLLARNDRDTHALFTEILQAYVDSGLVDYRNLRHDPRLPQYLEQLAATDPDTIASPADRLAFWINAYNAFTLQVICDSYPVRSINDLHFGGLYVGVLLNKTVWDRDFITIAGEQYSLNDIEHEIIRKRFDDARIHFALVCAAISCPPLRPEAYEGHKLETQLEEQGRLFFRQEDKNRFEPTKQVAHLSKILDWFEEDFGRNDEEVLRYVADFLPDSLRAAIEQAPGAWEIEYTEYDWSLNEQKK